MKIILLLMLIFAQLVSCASPGVTLNDDSGTFRSRWYNYYDRGLVSSEKTSWEEAERDLKKAVLMRDKDQRMARTYGMHFIDYFPHRELGVVYLFKGEVDQAISELELSLSQEESAKAIFYLNKARRQQLLDMKIQLAPPAISIASPADDGIVNDFTLTVKGTVSGEGYVSRLFVNDVPYRIELARNTVDFEQTLAINADTRKITVAAEDLLGNRSEKVISLSVDREGPAISIFDIVREQNGKDEIVRITGEVNDSTGIVSLALNDKPVNAGGITSYEFNVIADKRTFVLEAYDRLNNVTRAQIDIEKELNAFHEKQGPVLLAFAGTDMFSSDNAAPVITLKEAADMPPVFVDKYYVEGEVSDNRKVESVIVNGRDVLSKKGKKIFFSRLVKLDEGKNRMNIEAFDASGNRSAEDLTVTRTVPEVRKVGSRMSMSIMPFDTKRKESTVELLAFEQLTGSFVDQKRFNVIEREKLEQVLLEQKLAREKLTDPEYSIKVGRLMAAETILATSVAADQKSLEFTSRVINTETSEIMEVKDVYSEDTGPDAVRQMMEGLASKVAGSFPLVEGTVIKRENNIVYTDLGAGTGIKGKMSIIVYRKGKEIRHPLTGKSLGSDMETVGAADIEEIHEEFSKAKLSDKKAANNIKAQDLVITK